MHRFILILAVIFSFADSVKIPDYIKPCKKDDPKLNECARKQANIALPNILKGVKEFKTPSLQPLHIPLIEIKPSDTFYITLKDVVLNGLETVVIEDLQFDLKKQHILVKVAFSRLNIVCNYEMDGRILILPIKGNGPGNLTYEDVVVNFGFNYKLYKKNNGKEFVDSNLKPVVDFTLGKSYYHFDNLFNGDKALGDRMNEFLNEHGPEVSQDLGQSVSETISAVVTNILKLIITVVPYDELFV